MGGLTPSDLASTPIRYKFFKKGVDVIDNPRRGDRQGLYKVVFFVKFFKGFSVGGDGFYERQGKCLACFFFNLSLNAETNWRVAYA